MSNSPRNLTRNDLGEFLPNQRAVRAFEQLLKQVGDLLPSDIATINQLISEAYVEASSATARAQEALDVLGSISKSLNALAMAPVSQPFKLPGDIEGLLAAPPSEPAGTSASLLAAHVSAADPHTQYGLKTGKLSQFAATTSAELAGVIGDETGSGALVFGTNPTLTTPKATTTIGVGNATPAASGAGVSFPATQSPSTDANTLDDYEEGTFTPTVAGTTTAGTGTYTSQVGRYTKIGRMVHFTLSVTWTAHTGTGNTEIAGLPFTSVNATDTYGFPTFIQANGPIPLAGSIRYLAIFPNTSRVVCRETVLATMTITNANAITPTGTFIVSGTYEV